MSKLQHVLQSAPHPLYLTLCLAYWYFGQAGLKYKLTFLIINCIQVTYKLLLF